ncbi:MAG: 4Fe-4S dicluster domain-containing protein [Promethearchaeota archaeon]|jgi:Fe-S-cluster-containing hydrogenase component 2
MSEVEDQNNIESYKFHHVDISKCIQCKDFSCEEVCFRGIYEVINKDSSPRCTVVEDREDNCVKCHMCTTACKFKAITID